MGKNNLGMLKLTIGSYVRVRSSRYEARWKFGEHERCVRVARGVAESNSSFLSALQTSQVLHISMNAQMRNEPIVNYKETDNQSNDSVENLQRDS